MTEFQSKCMAAIEAELAKLAVVERTFHKRRRDEPYYFLGTIVRSHTVRFYVYKEEAEVIFDNDSWRSALCEKAGYDTDEELIASLRDILKERSNEPVPKEPLSVGLVNAPKARLWKFCWWLRVSILRSQFRLQRRKT